MLNVFDSKASKALLGLAIILIAGFQYLYWFGEGGHQDHQKLSQKVQQQIELNEELKERNRVLDAEVYDLKNGVEAIEEHARLDLGLVKPHETFVQMSTVNTQYKPIYVNPSQEDLRTNEEPAEEPPEP
ncbi:septum formation initiator family protein [Acinetobacter pragensis]|uniref:Cell division protein FtsB n=1 Tax=Acinetobacter pragensis TaxID=1806892 RepID=A0A151XXW1_9GAMM|nr:septum formation initiator family protein [Acinetobacter pragensis]KYQ70605.1 cell division protein FtsB [Acinetobacter pragensis]